MFPTIKPKYLNNQLYKEEEEEDQEHKKTLIQYYWNHNCNKLFIFIRNLKGDQMNSNKNKKTLISKMLMMLK